ncbi:hypothetical protein N7507_000668 [Penicillium longicatenatum]|nr:hypothetical protein N7507_000668 [Penicillium longicatenatum]
MRTIDTATSKEPLPMRMYVKVDIETTSPELAALFPLETLTRHLLSLTMILPILIMEEGPHPNLYTTRMSPNLDVPVLLMKGPSCLRPYQFGDGLVLRHVGVNVSGELVWV